MSFINANRMRSQIDKISQNLRLIQKTTKSVKPARVADKRLYPILVETREANVATASQILEVSIPTQSIRVANPQSFNEGDEILISTHPALGNVLFHGIIERIDEPNEDWHSPHEQDTWIKLSCHPREMTLITPNCWLLERSSPATGLQVYSTTQATKLDSDDIWRLKELFLAQEIQPPDDRIKRKPGETPEGFVTHFISCCDAPSDVLLTGPSPFTPMEMSRAWLLHRIVDESVAINGRWTHWDGLRNYESQNEGIPQIQFSDPEPKVMEMLTKCLSYINPNWNSSETSRVTTLTWFFRWLMWGLGHESTPHYPAEEVGISEKAHDYLIQVFDPKAFMLFPANYMGHLIAHVFDRPTVPIEEATDLLTRMTGHIPGNPSHSTDLILDVESGSGNMLLVASNYSYCYVGITSQNDLYQMAAIFNAYCYAPWLLFPIEWLKPEQSFAEQSNKFLSRYKELPEHYLLNCFPIERQDFAPLIRVEHNPQREVGQDGKPTLPQAPLPNGLRSQIGPSRPRIQMPGMNPAANRPSLAAGGTSGQSETRKLNAGQRPLLGGQSMKPQMNIRLPQGQQLPQSQQLNLPQASEQKNEQTELPE
ncbi:MAG TPA: hypothetical protein V6D29_04015 [Leptolyngbyaceae cyanobacterium]